MARVMTQDSMLTPCTNEDAWAFAGESERQWRKGGASGRGSGLRRRRAGRETGGILSDHLGAFAFLARHAVH